MRKLTPSRAPRSAVPSGAPDVRAERDLAGSPREPRTAGERAARHDAAPVSRVLSFVAIKRIDPRFPSTWGHWWVEVDGHESYGWWPLPCPLGLRRTITGTRGTLNGLGARTDGTPTRDPYHGDEPDHCFHPNLVVAKSDEEVRADIRAFAHDYVGAWHYSWWWLPKPAQNCRSFQWELFDAVGLVEQPEYLYTHGPGCPFMYPWRSAKWRVQDIAAAVCAHARAIVGRHRRSRSSPGAAASDRPLRRRGRARSVIRCRPADLADDPRRQPAGGSPPDVLSSPICSAALVP